MERLIVVAGQTRVGKSSFICDLVPDSAKIGQDSSRTTDKAQSVVWTSDCGIKVILVDTPGFDAARETDEESLRTISTYLKTGNRSQTPQLCGLVYVHMITDIQVGAASTCIRMFQQSCGLHSMENVAIITTMWDKVSPHMGEQWEKAFETLFEPLLDDGAVMMRHNRTRESAADIINRLLKEHTTPQNAHEFQNITLPPEETAEAEKNQVLIKAGGGKSVNGDTSGADKEPANKLPSVGPKGWRKRNETGRNRKTGPENAKRVARDSVSTPSKLNPLNSSCLMVCIELLVFVKLSKSILGSTRNVVSQNVVFRIVAFARRLEKDVQDKEKQRTVCKSILDDNGLPQVGHFLKEFEASLLETGRLWSEAQTFAKIGISDIKAHLGAPEKRLFFEFWRSGNRKAERNILTHIMGFLENIASDTKAVMEWWAPVFNTMEELRVKLPDDSHATGEFMSENDIKISLRYIREAMDLYYREYGSCVKEMLRLSGVTSEQREEIQYEQPAEKNSEGTGNKSD